MHDRIGHWVGRLRALVTPRTPGHHTHAYLHHASAAEPTATQRRQMPTHDATLLDTEVSFLVCPYVLAHEHRTGRAQATRHIGTFRMEVPR